MWGNWRRLALLATTVVLLFSVVVVLNAQVIGPPVKEDPLVRMPGTQPGEVALESPNRCLNCHAGYNTSVEPGFNWMGSMMAQSARDPLYFAALTVALQDSMSALGGSPNAGDLCLRCHFPQGWLEGRSDPTNASLMTGADWDGVSCDFCHSMWDPQFKAAHQEETAYAQDWDEVTSASQAAADQTYIENQVLAQNITHFNGTPFFGVDMKPASATYTEGTSGQYFVSGDGAKRASFVDAEARHQMLYSRYHKSKYFCGTCHDVSNAVLANLGADPAQVLPTEENAAHSYVHVERTFSEFMLSAYALEGGADGVGPFAPGVFETSNPGNKITMCQDCHMRDVEGTGADKRGVPVRPTDSTEHPNSGQPLHDLTGGNVWVSTMLASAIPGSPNHDPINAELLNQGPDILTLDLTQGQGIDPEALLAGADRAAQQLELAAAINGLTYDSASGGLTFKIQNQTGHKLISGFPEGRRMFVNIRVYDSGDTLIYEVNPYDKVAGTLKGLVGYDYAGLVGPAPLGSNEQYIDELVYEMHPKSAITEEDETFHFVLANERYKDNRIPPKGFRSAEAAERLSVPVWHGLEDANHFTTAEYAGGYDEVTLDIATDAAKVEVSLYYQTTSREYVEFLRDEINGTASTLPADSYVAQTDPFFAKLKAWGNTIWDLWVHNKDLPGAAPYLMTQTTWVDPNGGGGSEEPGCTLTPPTGLTAAPGNSELSLSWNAASGASGYGLYYDQADKTQLVTEVGDQTTYTDTGLTNGEQYCYVITASDATCESDFSAPVCATPNNAGQASTVTVSSVTTGYYGGKGNKTFIASSIFAQGDAVVIRTAVSDKDTGLPVVSASVEMSIVDGTDATVQTLNGVTDQDGLVEVSWSTTAPKGNRAGTPTGAYAAVTTGVAASSTNWDGVMTSADFTLLSEGSALDVILDPAD